MIDFHAHTFASDGVLVPSELIRRAQWRGYRAIALTDHADSSNLEDVVRRAAAAASLWKGEGIAVLPGVELTHVPPAHIPRLAREAKALGAAVVVVHGETVTEPVPPGTNAAAVRCPEVDILAHPGLLTEEDARAAAARPCLLEVTTRKGHSLANGHVVALARRTGAPTILNTDTHEPGDLITLDWARTVLAASGATPAEADACLSRSGELLRKILSRA